VKAGRIPIDGKIVLKSGGSITTAALASGDHGVEVAVSKAAVEPVWWLPGVAERFKVSETLLRRALFEDGGGQYPELLTRPDIKVFLPPIGGLTVYIFGPPEYLSDPTKELTVRMHDECVRLSVSHATCLRSFRTEATSLDRTSALAALICCMASRKPSRVPRRAAWVRSSALLWQN
jgi:hypothetical protein